MRVKFQRLIIGLLIAGMLICPVLAASAFPDVDENAEYVEAVEYVSGAGIMVGDEKGNFNPNKTITRAEMATIICNILGETGNITKIGGIFTDVPESHWASGYIAKAVSLGTISGHGDGRFGPDDKLTYEQAITMIVRALGGDSEAQEAGGYPDGYLIAARDAELLEGVLAIRGQLMTRAEIAMICYNSFKNI